MSKWYWRDGALAIDSEHDPEWLSKMSDLEKKLGDRDYRVVKQETLPNGRFISTVWLGLDHQWGTGPPLIFETIVFAGPGDWNDLDSDRYPTEAAAIAGHEAMKAKWS